MMDVKIVDEGFKLTLNARGYAAWEYEAMLTRLFAPRNGRACFQLAFLSEEAVSLCVDGAPHFSHLGKRPVLRVEVRCAYPVSLFIEDTHLDDDGAYRADALLRAPCAEVSANAFAMVFAEVRVPQNAVPGTEEITIRVLRREDQGDEALVFGKTLPLTIHPWTLPAPRELPLWLDLWQHPSNIARKHEIPLWSRAHFAVLENYVASLAALGQKAATVLVSDAPWRGQRCRANQRNPSDLYEYSMLGIARRKDGTLRVDFSVLDTWLTLCEKYDMAREIEVFGLVNLWRDELFDEQPIVPGDPEPYILLRCLDEKTGLYGYLHKSAEVAFVLAALENWFAETGRLSRVRITADEPADPVRFQNSIARVKAVAPRFRFKAAINHAPFIGEFSADIDDFAPNLQCACEEHKALAEYQQTLTGKRFLWYVCCAPDHPNTFLRSPLTQVRLIGALTHFLGFDGFLRWNYTVWPSDPRRDIRYGSFAAGDTNFVYPCPDGAPLLTLRYKALQRAVEDHAIYAALESAGQTELKQTLLARLIHPSAPEALFADGEPLPMEAIAAQAYGAFDSACEEALRALDAMYI